MKLMLHVQGINTKNIIIVTIESKQINSVKNQVSLIFMEQISQVPIYATVGTINEHHSVKHKTNTFEAVGHIVA